MMTINLPGCYTKTLVFQMLYYSVINSCLHSKQLVQNQRSRIENL